MEQLIHAFGIDVRLITIQILNFSVLAGLLTYFLYKPVLKLLAEREDTIKKGITDAEEAAVAKASALDEKKLILTQAQKEAQEIDTRAQAYGKEKTVELLLQAQAKASEVIKDAEQKSTLLKENARKESEAEIAKLAVLAAEKVLAKKSS